MHWVIGLVPIQFQVLEEAAFDCSPLVCGPSATRNTFRLTLIPRSRMCSRDPFPGGLNKPNLMSSGKKEKGPTNADVLPPGHLQHSCGVNCMADGIDRIISVLDACLCPRSKIGRTENQPLVAANWPSD